jgi:hypothetical protein
VWTKLSHVRCVSEASCSCCLHGPFTTNTLSFSSLHDTFCLHICFCRANYSSASKSIGFRTLETGLFRPRILGTTNKEWYNLTRPAIKTTYVAGSQGQADCSAALEHGRQRKTGVRRARFLWGGGRRSRRGGRKGSSIVEAAHRRPQGKIDSIR